MNNSSKKLYTLIYTALAIAMVTLSTMAIRIPAIKGYVNFGDIMIFAAAVLIGKRTGFLAGSIGSAMADVLSGYAIYAPGTFIIKGLEGLICAFLIKKNDDGTINILSLIISVVAAAAFMVAGYFMYEYVLFGYPTAIGSIPGNILQGGVSAAASLPIVLAIKKTKFSLNIEK
jgi:uncharacterized membrane protein